MLFHILRKIHCFSHITHIVSKPVLIGNIEYIRPIGKPAPKTEPEIIIRVLDSRSRIIEYAAAHGENKFIADMDILHAQSYLSGFGNIGFFWRLHGDKRYFVTG